MSDLKKEKLLTKIRRSPINYFSDLFIIAMVSLWIFDCIYESIIASVVTISSIFLSYKVGANCFDTSMWSSIGSNVSLPLSVGGALWMTKNAVQHAIRNRRGENAPEDFPAVHPEGENETIELEQEERG